MRFISNSDFGANLLLPAALHNNVFGWGLLVKTNWKKQEKRALAQNLKSQPEILKNQRRLPLGNREFREKVVHFLRKTISRRMWRRDAVKRRQQERARHCSQRRKITNVRFPGIIWLHETWCSRKRTLKPIGFLCDTW